MAGRRAATSRSVRFPGLARELLDWFDRTKRPLPWRAEPSPYRAWLSEIALQQTRVAQAIPLYERLIARFPDVGALARASEEEVLKAWEGAGYYARARNLRRAAREIIAGSRAPRWPRGSHAWAKLPGIGPYSAHALASRLDGEAVGALDANARRVAVRWSLERGPATSGRVTRRLQHLLDGLIPRDRPGDFNEAVMELGETVCRPRAPDCPACPVARHCRAQKALPDPSVLPRTRRRPPRPEIEAAIAVIERGGRWLVQRRRSEGLLGGLWEFPGGKMKPGEPAESAVRREVYEETGMRLVHLEPVGIVRHAYSHFSVRLHLFTGRPRSGAMRRERSETLRWVTPDDFAALPRPMATIRAARLLSGGRAPAAGALGRLPPRRVRSPRGPEAR